MDSQLTEKYAEVFLKFNVIIAIGLNITSYCTAH